MGYAEKRCNLWRARWHGPDGTLETAPGFQRRKDAEDYARDQEAAIRNNTYVDPRAGQITLTEWVNTWFPAQDLELNTLSTYRYTIEVHILPLFGGWSLRSLELQPEAVALWEKQIVAGGYTRRTARESRSTPGHDPRRCDAPIHPVEPGCPQAWQGPERATADRAGGEG